MDWERYNVWTSTLYAILHSIEIARSVNFGDLENGYLSVIASSKWINPDCSFNSSLLAKEIKEKKFKFRRNPNDYFDSISNQIVNMLIQDLTVIMDEMMGESLFERGIPQLDSPFQKIEKLATYLTGNEYEWAKNGCFELVAVRNALTHSRGVWSQKSIDNVKSFIPAPPQVGEKIVIGIPMLFRYRKAMRTFLDQTKIKK